MWNSTRQENSSTTAFCSVFVCAGLCMDEDESPSEKYALCAVKSPCPWEIELPQSEWQKWFDHQFKRMRRGIGLNGEYLKKIKRILDGYICFCLPNPKYKGQLSSNL